MKLINDLLNWSFVGVSFIIYILTQFILGLIFVGDKWQVTEGLRYRFKKLLELGIPVLMGLLVGYLIAIPAPDVIFADPIARSIYFGFAGGASPLVHTAAEAAFPQIASSITSKVTDVIKNSINSISSSSKSSGSSKQQSHDQDGDSKNGE